MPKNNNSDDPRFHYEIWAGPSPEFGQPRKSISYVENHNSHCGYAELAFDFRYAVELLIEQYKHSRFGNWVAPIAHLSRQLIELYLKALMEAVKACDASLDSKPLGYHNLNDIWIPCRNWLMEKGYKLPEDARLEMTEQLISAFHEIDPSGDLFRFGVSRKTAFGKQKSYDRVGIEIESFEQELNALVGLLNHWEVTLFRGSLKAEMGWDKDPHFNQDDFPKK